MVFTPLAADLGSIVMTLALMTEQINLGEDPLAAVTASVCEPMNQVDGGLRNDKTRMKYMIGKVSI